MWNTAKAVMGIIVIAAIIMAALTVINALFTIGIPCLIIGGLVWWKLTDDEPDTTDIIEVDPEHDKER
jgi:sugar phosphate permease